MTYEFRPRFKYPRPMHVFLEAGLLKRMPRSGWFMAGVENPESVAEHSWRAAVIAYFFAKEAGLDPYKCATMAVFHDIAETRVWDIPWLPRRRGYISKDEEKAAWELLQDEELFRLWKEVDEKNTPEGKLVKDAEYFEMAITAYEYAREGYESAREWADNLEGVWRTEIAKKYYAELKKLGPEGVAEFWKWFANGLPGEVTRKV